MQYICFRKTSGWNMGRQICFLLRAPSNLVTPLVHSVDAVVWKYHENRNSLKVINTGTKMYFFSSKKQVLHNFFEKDLQRLCYEYKVFMNIICCFFEFSSFSQQDIFWWWWLCKSFTHCSAYHIFVTTENRDVSEQWALSYKCGSNFTMEYIEESIAN